MDCWNNTTVCTLFQNVIDSFAVHSDQIAVAVSGGIDSIVLLHLITNWTKKKHHPLPIALTVDHGLRPESKQEANFVVNYAKKLGLESFILNWEKQDITGNVQLRAREARYKLLTEWCKSNNIRYLFVAHHKDDQAETFLLRLERGSGTDGLSSMHYKSFMNNVCILRPLLNFSRSNIEKYANFHQLKYVEDRSNKDLKYRRTLYRNLLKASDNQEILTERICLTALHMQRATKALMHYTRLAFSDCVTIHELGFIEIKLSRFHQLPEEIALRLLLYSIMVIGSKNYKPRYNSLIFIFNKILQKDCDINHTLSECKIKKYGESILIIREASKIKEVPINLPMSESIQWDNRFRCTILGGQECSVTIAPLKKTQKIPEFLKDYNCCTEVFYSLPVVRKDEKVIAYPFIKHDNKNLNNDTIQCTINCIIEENLLSLINI
ncbi:tRNA lysidine(34) synthetase TilS [Wolbachia endosymbiont of Folsomia candida]|uniref:tRNA lysidine(34) synthetase TilS n=1 Tax=Wolbachia endosymbiont of Folsomia candida TaxID=169402 RepID=UPI000A62B3B4|nr:tRNA lysidine(34) synthetase TilS [Wolbachia endosymbiont of Folsomia candida]APR98118.1 tRNA lysidine(34) synthetase TilS [Wolbachia endosymbiont of Folsomia candida]